MLDSYEINSSTLAIIAVSETLSRIIEKERELYEKYFQEIILRITGCSHDLRHHTIYCKCINRHQLPKDTNTL